MSRFAADWLALREPADAAARDSALARQFATSLPMPARLADFGAGTGANARALAPLIGGDQDWLLVEPDQALRRMQRATFVAWAERAGHTARDADGCIIVAARSGTWRFTNCSLDLAQDWLPLETAALDAVTCSAFLDLASADWIGRLAAWLERRRLPLYAALTVDGRRAWTPAAPEDAIVAAAFRRDQARDKGLGPALGDKAAAYAGQCLGDQGFIVSDAASDWRLGPDSPLLEALLRGTAEAALAAAPEAADTVARWRERRLAQAAAATLGLTVGHRDLLALPS